MEYYEHQDDYIEEVMESFNKIFHSRNIKLFREVIGTWTIVAGFLLFRLREFGTSATDILMFLYFLKSYNKTYTNVNTFQVNHQKFSETVWRVMNQVIEHLNNTIDFLTRFQDVPTSRLFENVCFIIDGTECFLYRPSDNHIQRIYYSGKKKRHMMKYHIVVSIVDGHILDVCGPFYGKVHDITMAKSWIESNNIVLQEGEMFLG
ncbi:hypothetical protein AKO1_002581, partial [Acrasis kona]